MTNLFIKGNIAKAFWIMLGFAVIIVSVGMAWSLVIRGFCTVNLAPKKTVHSLESVAGAYSVELPDSIKDAFNKELERNPNGKK
jgi:hypothetical protein